MSDLDSFPTITIRQPFASLIADGSKTIELRTWNTKIRGPILIHAGLHDKHENALPYGAIVAIVDLRDVLPINDTCDYATIAQEACVREEWLREQFSFGRFLYAWYLSGARKIEPVIPMRGFPGFFKTSSGLIHG